MQSWNAAFFLFFFSWLFVGGGGGGISGRVRALNLTVPLGSGRVGSDNLGYGPGSGFSFEPVQTSSLHCLYLCYIYCCGALSDRYFSCGVLFSVSVFQVPRLFLPGGVSVFPEGCGLDCILCLSWRLCTAGFTAPALPMISAPPLCFGVCTCTASLSSPPLCFGVVK